MKIFPALILAAVFSSVAILSAEEIIFSLQSAESIRLKDDTARLENSDWYQNSRETGKHSRRILTPLEELVFFDSPAIDTSSLYRKAGGEGRSRNRLDAPGPGYRVLRGERRKVVVE